MMRRHPRTALSFCCALFLGSFLQAPVLAEPAQLTDQELDRIYAQGLLVHIDINLDVASAGVSVPRNSVFIQNVDSPPAGSFSFDPGSVLSVSNSTISISGNALANTQSLLNVIATGDVAVGINLSVFIGNLVDSTLNNTSTTLNFSNLSAGLTSSRNSQ